ncbi:cytosine permease [Proteiniborus sp.]|uniref:purine-cytosine permease family protein n=1 Tax=Proteiniborus sp. TaxID=2079015 RepID=UPI00332BFE69
MSEKNNSNALENAFNSVPDSERKSLLSLTVVLAGYPIALSNFVIGGAVGVGMTFSKATTTLLVGNAILIAIVLATGYMAFKTGLSTSFLSRRVFGKKGSTIFSLLLAFSSVTWISLNGDIFARLIDSTFSWWPLPISITAILCIALWTQSAIRGYKGLEFISYLGVPAALVMSIAGVIAVGKASGGYADIFTYVPATSLSFTAATASIIGGWVFGATITPDVCRFAKSTRDLVIAGIVAFTIGCFGLQFAGALVGIKTGNGDFTAAMTSLGLGVLAFFAAIFCLWTTQDNNIYGASLAIQNVLDDTSLKGKVKHKHIALAIAGLAAIFAALGIFNYLVPITQTLSVLIPPVPGLLIAEEAFVRNSKENMKVNPIAMVSWLLAGIASYIALKTDMFVPPIVGIISSVIFYVILSKIFDAKHVAKVSNN